MAEIGRLIFKNAVWGVVALDGGVMVLENGTRAVPAQCGDALVMTDDAALAALFPSERVQSLTSSVKKSSGDSVILTTPSAGTTRRPLSFSGISTFQTCPKQYEHLYILQDVERTSTEATMWGSRVHKEIEDYLTGAIACADETTDMARVGIAMAEKMMAAMPDAALKVEAQWGLTREWKPCGFAADEAALRGIIDMALIGADKALLVDWKTGKKKDNTEQMDMFALHTFLANPSVTKIRGIYAWLKTGETTVADYARDNLDSLKDLVTRRAEEVWHTEEIGEFPMRTSGLCRGWCPVRHCPAFVDKR